MQRQRQKTEKVCEGEKARKIEMKRETHTKSNFNDVKKKKSERKEPSCRRDTSLCRNVTMPDRH